ncbi:hypothetical protein BMW23_0858 [Bodo saltans virus]|uniref:Uncharacterized protein n=1 Tax=Bodo saltans virus TaxID=2024608 RepID=A0A2H4UVF2_9VIRU|nr:hypothetical protein QJ851_gp0840 [Bodo saltans virus]ATZ80903.1 hypothetical protein BMW23_0858 [Bodo saltans virus]
MFLLFFYIIIEKKLNNKHIDKYIYKYISKFTVLTFG